MSADLDSIVHGVVILDGERYHLAIRSEMLIVDAVAWFEYEREKHARMATEAKADGDDGFACDMKEVAEEIAALLAAGRPLDQPGLWPQVRNRSVLMPWRVEDNPAAIRAYARTLLEFGSVSDRDELDFVLRVDEGGGEIHATSRLRNQARFASPLRAHVVDRETLSRWTSDAEAVVEEAEERW